MTIFNTSYDTTLGSAIVTKNIEMAIKTAIINDGIEYNNLNLIPSEKLKPIFIVGNAASESNIPFFTHPMVVIDHHKREFLVSDLRPFIKQGVYPITPKNTTEFNFVKSRTVLNMAWLENSPLELKNTFGFAATVYSAWLSEVIAKKFALDPRDQLMLAIVCHYFFQSLHYPEDKFDENRLQMFAVHTMKATKADSQMVFSVFDKITQSKVAITSIEGLCEMVKVVLENIRLEDFNVGVLISCIATSWFGANAKEIIAVALEHPPTWYAVVHTALFEKTYQHSMIAKIAERYSKNGVGADYLKDYSVFVQRYLEREGNTKPVEFKTFS